MDEENDGLDSSDDSDFECFNDTSMTFSNIKNKMSARKSSNKESKPRGRYNKKIEFEQKPVVKEDVKPLKRVSLSTTPTRRATTLLRAQTQISVSSLNPIKLQYKKESPPPTSTPVPVPTESLFDTTIMEVGVHEDPKTFRELVNSEEMGDSILVRSGCAKAPTIVVDPGEFFETIVPTESLFNTTMEVGVDEDPKTFRELANSEEMGDSILVGSGCVKAPTIVAGPGEFFEAMCPGVFRSYDLRPRQATIAFMRIAPRTVTPVAMADNGGSVFVIPMQGSQVILKTISPDPPECDGRKYFSQTLVSNGNIAVIDQGVPYFFENRSPMIAKFAMIFLKE